MKIHQYPDFRILRSIGILTADGLHRFGIKINPPVVRDLGVSELDDFILKLSRFINENSHKKKAHDLRGPSLELPLLNSGGELPNSLLTSSISDFSGQKKIYICVQRVNQITQRASLDETVCILWSVLPVESNFYHRIRNWVQSSSKALCERAYSREGLRRGLLPLNNSL